MIKQAMLGAAAVTGLTVSACTPTSVDAWVATVQAQTKLICDFVPTAVAIEDLLNVPGASDATAVAQTICDAFNASKSNKFKVHFRGSTVVVSGHRG